MGGAALLAGVAGAAPMSLVGSLNATPPVVCPSQPMTLSLTVENAGTEAVTGVVPDPAPLLSGTGTAMMMAGPVPSMVSMLEPGMKQVFTWSYYPQGPGTLYFTASAAGMVASFPVSTGAVVSNTATIVDPGNLGIGVAADAPSSATVGQWFRVVMIVSDLGGAGVQNVMPSIAPAAGGELVMLMFGPEPAGPAAISPGQIRSFTWTYSASGSGDVTFSVSAAGGVCGMPVWGAASAAVVVYAAPVVAPSYGLEAAIGVVPAAIRVGEDVEIIMTVMNTGTGSLANVVPGTLRPSGSGAATLSVPVPAGVAILQPGRTASFTWRATGAMTGAVAWWGRAQAAGADVTGGAAASEEVLSPTIRIESPAVLAPDRVEASASAPKGRVSGVVDLTFRVLDASGAPVPGATVTMEVVAGGGLVLPEGSRTDGNGEIRARLRLGPQEGANLVRVAVAGGSDPAAVVRVDGELPGVPTPYLSKNFFNPAKGESVQIRVMVPEPMRAVAKVFDMSGELVRLVNDGEVPAGLTVWEWDGRNGTGEIVGNGMYFVQIASGRSVQVKRIIVLKRG